MDSKVTRRVALGVIFGGLAASPLVIRYLRSDRPLPTKGEVPYDKFAVDPQIVKSDLSAQELQTAFDSLFAERDMWLRFRGVSGTIKIFEEGASTTDDAFSSPPTCEGFVRLSLEHIQLDGNMNVYPFASEFIYSKTKDSAPLTEFVLDRNQNKRETKGERIEGLEPDFITQLLSSPLEMFAAFQNKVLQDLMTSLWTITRVSPQSIAFKPNAALSADGFRAPEMEFTQGHLAKFTSKQMKGKPFTVTVLESPVESNGFFFPSRWHFILHPNGDTSCKEFKLSVLLSDINVVVG